MKRNPVRSSAPPAGKTRPAEKKAKPPAKKLRLPGSWKANGYLFLFFLCFAFILYGNTILNHYAVDDVNVTNNELVSKGFKAIPEIFSSRYMAQQGNIGSMNADYRPLVKATFAIEHQLWGNRAGRSHAINVLLYAAASILLFSLLRRILKKYNILFPFLVTVLFMAHPVHTEVVASLKNRDELLAFIFGLSSLWYIVNYAESGRFYHLPAAMLLFVIGYLGKSSILPFIPIAILILVFFYNFSMKRLWPVIGLLLVAWIIVQFGPRVYLGSPVRENLFLENPLFGEKNILLRLGTGLVSLLFYIKILFYPYPLLYYYGFDMIPVTGLFSPLALLSLGVHGGLLFVAIRGFKERKMLSFAIFWYLLGIAMYSNMIFPVVGIVGERFVFTASLGFVIAILLFFFRIFRTDPQSLTIEMDARLKIITMVFLVLVPCTVLTVTRNRAWRELWDLYKSDIRHLENSAKANIDYAGFLMNTVYTDENFLRTGAVNQFKYQIIVSHFRRALTLHPDNYKTTNDLGTVYLFIGKDYDSAVYFLNKAISIDSTLQPAWVNLGMAYRERKEYDKAIQCYEHILRQNPGQVKAIFALANVYNDMGDFDRAVKMNEEVMQKFPGLEMPYVNIGNYYMLRQDTVQAVAWWEKAVGIRPSYELCLQLNTLYIIRGDKAKADYYYDLGIQILKQQQ